MGASRENYNIYNSIKRKDWKLVKLSIIIILFPSKSNKWKRQYIIKDSFIRPFNKKVGCRLFGHKWSTEEDDIKYGLDGRSHCWKCGKWQTKEETRDEKIKLLIK